MTGVVPVGGVIPYAGDLVKEDDLRNNGWLPCDGRPMLSTNHEYEQLYGVIGKCYGAGFDDNGVRKGDFNLPDYRGRFLRGVSAETENSRDPDVHDRLAMKPGGNTGNQVGTVQEEGTRLPVKNAIVVSDVADHSHKDPTWNGGPGPYELATLYRGPGGYDYGNEAAPTEKAGGHKHELTGGDHETRPVNIYVNWVIRFK